MKRNIILIFLSVICSVNLISNEKYIAVNEKTTLVWLGEKVLGQHTGTINLQTGWLTWKDDRILSGEFVIDMGSLMDSDRNQRLEMHLKSDDFFGVDKHPISKLVITGSTPFDKGTAIVKGNLTIKGITNSIEFKASRQESPEGKWFYANIIVDRSKYNVRYGSGSFFDNLGDKTIYDEFKLKVNLLVRKS